MPACMQAPLSSLRGGQGFAVHSPFRPCEEAGVSIFSALACRSATRHGDCAPAAEAGGGRTLRGLEPRNEPQG